MPIPACAAGVPIFRLLPADALRRLGAALRHKDYRKGSLVLGAGQMMDRLIVVAHGRLNLVHTTGSGRAQIVRVLEPGDFIGEMALFNPAPAEGDLVAAADSTVCMLPRAVVQSLLAEHPGMAQQLVVVLADRLQRAEQLIGDLGLKDVGQRLAAELWRLASPEQDEPLPAGTVVKVPAPWVEIATRLGTTPESLSRRLKAFADRGIIEQLDSHTIVLLQPDQLKFMAAADA